ncbi:methylenetetrahydrofolate--tRNA-(uracil-5-)-methyltransferase [Desulfonispora thiosulfatigenes DSM 11270]|uniref:Methylenetetrahydrofolate--tRNA-(uracil-5-)-methyltransferase TrmFO n=1 Tax=Desulfonispora thiosulfatigenes DSM 11270 TaxID=656914 RepID=A0A1W1VKN2_DESTI|nr:methylenetetrahydrofolate--tRNA-(uracil(54)-C(5))-methyltransferase (FADH(2)-oxidizing) TrmFO [Desulfonispora thiosulfatigenes]SMB93945.1 methylenetetrahydrofolate--tRNA-(uracil-5-)-methyltransferase [Desulfonispora thiosulfatigenes DSM 11270]
MDKGINVIGAGLAGCEAAWQIAQRGIKVNLYEMRPNKTTAAHKTPYFAELICSNSLRGAGLENAVGLLKEELRQCDSVFMQCADLHRIPAGGALAVDREGFAKCMTEKLSSHPLVTIIHEEITKIDSNRVNIIATGPLTEGLLVETIKEITGEDYFYFYDAAAPILTTESIDTTKAFWASRYDKGEADYLNCPMNEDEYRNFYKALVSAEVHPIKKFEKEVFFEGCMPVEVMAKRGEKTLLFGPLKPVGLTDPRTGKQPYAVVQLRKDNKDGSLLNIVGFQTHLKWGEQKQVLSLIPGLENAEIVRYGVMHRNTFINSPKTLDETGQVKKSQNIYFAGQITGVEGYVESATSGLVAGINACRMMENKAKLIFPKDTAIGGLMSYIVNANSKNFQPMNINFGLLPPLEKKIKNKKEKNVLISSRALESLHNFKIEEF